MPTNKTSRQRVEARYPGAYCCANILRSKKWPAVFGYIICIKHTRRIIGTGKTERAAWINAAKGLK